MRRGLDGDGREVESSSRSVSSFILVFGVVAAVVRLRLRAVVPFARDVGRAGPLIASSMSELKDSSERGEEESSSSLAVEGVALYANRARLDRVDRRGAVGGVDAALLLKYLDVSCDRREVGMVRLYRRSSAFIRLGLISVRLGPFLPLNANSTGFLHRARHRFHPVGSRLSIEPPLTRSGIAFITMQTTAFLRICYPLHFAVRTISIVLR